MNLKEQFDRFSETDSLLEFITLAVLTFIAAFLLHYIVFRLLKLIERKSDRLLWDVILSKGFHSTRYLIWVIFLFVVQAVFLEDEGEIQSNVRQGLKIALIITISWVLVSVVDIARTSLLATYDLKSDNNLQARKVHTQFRLLGNIIKFLVIIVATGLALMSFESIRQFGVSLLASAGIAGIILGLAAQKLIATVLAGLQLAITQPIRLDDVLIVEGEWGRVEEITLTYVVIAIWDKRRLVVPSTYFIEKPFQNWTRVSADLLGTVFIYTDYRFPVDALRKELKNIVTGNPLWDEQVAIVQVTDSKEKTMELRVLVSAKNSPTAWDLRVDVREKLISFIQRDYPDMLPQSRIEVLDRDSSSSKSEDE